MAPVNYVGKPPSATIEDDVEEIKAAVEDIQSASGSREESLTLHMAPGNNPTNLLTTDPTTFKEPGTDVAVTAPEEIFRYVVDTPEIGTRPVTSLKFEFSWQTRVVSGGAGNGESYWEIGEGDAPTTWRRITDLVPATEEVEDHGRSGNMLPAEAAQVPFTLRLVGRVFSAGLVLRTDILSTSKVHMTYRAI
jgi:hypothetical protein